MHPNTLATIQSITAGGDDEDFVKQAVEAKHFHVSKGVEDFALAVSNHESSRWSGFPLSSRPPADKVILTFDSSQMVFLVMRVVDGSGRDMVGIAVSGCVDGRANVCTIGAFRPGSDVVKLAATKVPDMKRVLLFRVPFLLSLINHPRKVIQSPASGAGFTRQHRKQVQKITGMAAMAYTVVSWELGKKVKAKDGQITTNGHRNALHWCRAHWRKAEAGHPSSEWVQPSVAEPFGWWTWVADCWKGHPDYGIKLQNHEPRMIGEKRAGASAPTSILRETQLEAISAAHRSALVQAGYASSMTLH